MLPSFETERLLLRPRTMDDLEDCYAINSDPDVVRYIDGPWNDPDAHRRFLVSRIEASYPAGLGYWSVVRKSAPHRVLGWVTLVPLDGPNDDQAPDIEIGWRFAKPFWGRGLAPEAARALLHHGFETVGLQRIVAIIQRQNLRSIRVAQKLGMKRAGTMLYHGKSVLRFVAAIAAAGFAPGR